MAADAVLAERQLPWIVVDARQGLSFSLLCEAAERLSTAVQTPWAAPDTAAWESDAREALERLDPAVRQRDGGSSVDLAATVACLGRLPAARWSCPTLPWWPVEGLPPASLLALAPQANWLAGTGPCGHLQPGAVALLASMGAFREGTPPLARVRQVATAGDTSFQLRLALLEPSRPSGISTPEIAALEARFLQALSDAAPQTDEVAVLTFLVDDQSPEDLAIGLDRIRALAGVLDVCTVTTQGKKGRLAFRVEVLAQPESAPDAVRACLAETTTIGLRWHLERRVILRRELQHATGPSGRSGAVKHVVRPGGQYSSKLESDVLAALDVDRLGRQELRSELESAKRT